MAFTRQSTRLALFLLILNVVSIHKIWAQNAPKKYGSLLWEITGNGLKKPSYLFGTMHISNKMVFHLSDSFYAAIKSVDVVAIELDPEEWQRELPRTNVQNKTNRHYNSFYYTDYLKYNSFSYSGFINELQATMRYEPELNNNLLYRTENRMENFQEDTYLDLYIYQTGKKLGKKTTGVETFFESQKMMVEGYIDAAIEERKKKDSERNRNNHRYYDIGSKMQDAYRRGDLDMLDSLNKLSESAPSFTEKFLFQRNISQATAMDSIMHNSSLFVGVGAAHLPGERGVIELLRKKGYQLRPIYMLDRDAEQKKLIDTIKVPVHFTKQVIGDSLIEVAAPGKLITLDEDASIMQYNYADMANGSYYLISRIPTKRIYNGFSDAILLKKVDSLLYENIPGTIQTKEALNNETGYKIVARTKSGDVQQYRFYITPFEIIVFKMAGKGNYALGQEAQTFFNSIKIKQTVQNSWQKFVPDGGGFEVSMPAQVVTSFEQNAADGLPEWQYQAFDAQTGNLFTVVKKTIYTFDFIEKDSFHTYLMLESFLKNKQIEGTPKFNQVMINGRQAQEVLVQTTSGWYLKARAIVFGPQFYVQIMGSKHKIGNDVPFFKDFQFKPFTYDTTITFVDTNANFSVTTPIYPKLDKDMKDLIAYQMKANLSELEETYVETPQNISVNFMSNTTGEVILVTSAVYPKYTQFKDSANFWSQVFHIDSSLILKKNTPLKRNNGTIVWDTQWSDTGSTQVLRKLTLQNGMRLLSVMTVIDTALPQSSFINNFFSTFDFNKTVSTSDLFSSKQQYFFDDYFSKDTIISAKAKTALDFMDFEKGALPLLQKALNELKSADKNYLNSKVSLIAAMGRINDTVSQSLIIEQLKELYFQAGDTSMFQNSVLQALAQLKSVPAAQQFKELLLQDPPVFDNEASYNQLFASFNDSLQLATNLFPELLNLSNIEDYKLPVRNLLSSLVDSAFINPNSYDDYVGNMFFDAKILAKKTQATAIGQSATEDNAGYNDRTRALERILFNNFNNEILDNLLSNQNLNLQGWNAMSNYIALLTPYYNKNPNVANFLNKQLKEGSTYARVSTAFAFLKYNYKIAPETWAELFKDKSWQLGIYERLAEQNKLNLLSNGQSLSANEVAAIPLYSGLDKQLDTLVWINAQPLGKTKENKQVHFFKYRKKQEQDWLLAASFTQNDKNGICRPLTNKIKVTQTQVKGNAKEIGTIVQKELNKINIESRDAGRAFFRGDNEDDEE